MNWDSLANRVLEGYQATREDALNIVNSSDTELLSVLQASYRLRHHHHGNVVKLHVLRNAKSGLCPEDCAFCSQSVKFKAPVERYKMQTVEELVEGAKRAYEMGAVTYCMVTSTRGPSAGEVEAVCEATRQIKEKYPLRICASMGMLKPGQAEILANGGVDRYNHNVETSPNHFSSIVSTHSIDDRINTVKSAKAAGMEACSGGILGMGEGLQDWVDLALLLRELEVESIPVNFLNPRPGTPLADQTPLSARDALRALAMFRFVNPTRDIRIAGGREVILGSMQALALYPANSFFSEGYLTTGGQGNDNDQQMIEQAGFVAEIANA